MKKVRTQKLIQKSSEMRIPQRAHGALDAYAKAFENKNDDEFSELLVDFCNEGLMRFGVSRALREEMISYLDSITVE